jgi:translation initiation factor IF-2
MEPVVGTKKKLRPPIVVVVGHVDHGKTTLLDYIRKSTYETRAASSGGEPRSVAEREAGGITQAISAYEIEHKGKRMTFIDTPGHEAFQAMRVRGANVANLAILVVAADEGVKPQTAEAIKALEETKTPFVVAVNKVDKEGADIERVKQELSSAGIFLEGYGGQVSFQPISAKTGKGVNELLELLLLAWELEEATYDPGAPASGFVLEARINSKRGIEVAVIITEGTLRKGDEIVTTTASGKVKILENFRGEQVKELEPSSPAVIIGFDDLPAVGEQFTAGAGASARLQGGPRERSVSQALGQPIEGDGALTVVLKASDAGSLEALSQIVRSIESEKPIRVLGESVGDVVDADVKLAIPTKGVVVGFKSKVQKSAKIFADAQKVGIVTSDIVYKLVEAVEEVIRGGAQAAPTVIVEVLAVFNKEKLDKQLVGGRVTEGTVRVKQQFELSRGKEIVGQGRVLSLREVKRQVDEMSAPKECGLLVSCSCEVAVGDTIVVRP